MKKLFLTLSLIILSVMTFGQANTNPIFCLTPQFSTVSITGTCNDRTGGTTTNLQTLVTAASNGTKVTEIGYHFQGTSVSALFWIFVTNTSGTSPMLYQELLISATTPSATVSAASGYVTFADFQLKSGQLVLVGITEQSGSVACFAYAKKGDY